MIEQEKGKSADTTGKLFLERKKRLIIILGIVAVILIVLGVFVLPALLTWLDGLVIHTTLDMKRKCTPAKRQ